MNVICCDSDNENDNSDNQWKTAQSDTSNEDVVRPRALSQVIERSMDSIITVNDAT